MSSFKEAPGQIHDDNEYKRLGSDAGLLVIFNQQTYDDEDFEFRSGTNADVNALILTFGRLGFNIDTYYIFNDLSRKEILDVIDTTSREDHSDRNCLIVVVLTHGEEHNLVQASDAPVLADEIWEPFVNSASLKDKPKFFIFQACKGKKYSTSDKPAGSVIPEATFKSPLASDMLIAFSNVEDAMSLRHPKKGTWFIQELCWNFGAFGRKEDVITLLLRVSKCVTYNYYHEEIDKETTKRVIVKQMPLLMSTLSKKFYLSRSKDRSTLLCLEKQQEVLLNTIDNVLQQL